MEALENDLGKRAGKGLERKKIKKQYSSSVGNVSERNENYVQISKAVFVLWLLSSPPKLLIWKEVVRKQAGMFWKSLLIHHHFKSDVTAGMLKLASMMVVRKDGSERWARIRKQDGLEDAVVDRKRYQYLNVQRKWPRWIQEENQGICIRFWPLLDKWSWTVDRH